MCIPFFGPFFFFWVLEMEPRSLNMIKRTKKSKYILRFKMCTCEALPALKTWRNRNQVQSPHTPLTHPIPASDSHKPVVQTDLELWADGGPPVFASAFQGVLVVAARDVFKKVIDEVKPVWRTGRTVRWVHASVRCLVSVITEDFHNDN